MLDSVAGWVSCSLPSRPAGSGFLSLEELFHHHFNQLCESKYGGVFCSCMDSV